MVFLQNIARERERVLRRGYEIEIQLIKLMMCLLVFLTSTNNWTCGQNLGYSRMKLGQTLMMVEDDED